ncbi:S8 family serine peptidase [Streptomyces sp. NPDC090025]|uniref:S8 family serine peptidase n=1 Tax=Streptomyces sp. NPDC090025 TaxID=3365922 RepID=UPI0038344A38
MRAMRRGAAPLLSALALVGAATAPGVAAGTADETLPVVVQTLADDAPCRPASGKRAAEPPWTQDMLGLDRVWRMARGRGVAVAVVGTGVGATVPALLGRVTPVGAGSGQDCVGHGSFVAGLIAAAPREGAGFTGVAPEARILAVRATSQRGAATPAGVARGIEAAVRAGADVIAVPYAFSARRPELTAAVRLAARADALVVAPAAPDKAPVLAGTGDLPPRDYWPAAEPGVLSVLDFGADGSRPQNALVPRHADLGAPGDRVVSVGPGGEGAFTGSGSSLAVGFAAGAAALVRSYEPGIDAARTRTRLLGGSYTSAVPRLDPYAAVSGVLPADAAPAPRRADPVTLPVPVPDGGARSRSLLIATGALSVALLLGALAVVLPRARARGWRAG